MPELIDTLRLDRQGGVDASGMEFTAIDVETTALHPGRVIEIGAVRVNGEGRVLGEFSTLVNPGPGVDPGATWVHHITRRDLDDAPALSDVAGYLIELCTNSVLVAHNLPFESRFLTAEFDRIRPHVPRLPGVCTLSTARSLLRLPNYKLATLVEVLDLPAIATHAALDDARACGQLVVRLVTDHGLRFRSAPRFPALPQLPRGGRCAPRVTAIRAGERGWMASLMDRLPESMPHAHDPALEAAYRDQLTQALADNKISGKEAKALAQQARTAGMSAADVRRVHTEAIGSLRRLAEQDGVITPKEYRDLTKAAAALGVPDLVADLEFVNNKVEAAEKTTVPLRPTRVLVLGVSPAADETRARVLTEGLALAKNLTATVTHVVVDHTVPDDDARKRKAAGSDVALLTVDEVASVLGWTTPQHADQHEPAAEAVPHEPQPPATAHLTQPQDIPEPQGLPYPTGQPALPTTEPVVNVPARAPGYPVRASSHQPRPAPAPRASALLLWTARLVLGFGVVLVVMDLLAAAGGAPATALIGFGIFALIVVAAGEFMRRKARGRV